jgi:hypothetical protein
MLENAKKRGEPILGVCVQDCDEQSDQDIQGFERGRVVELQKPAYPPIARAAHVSGRIQVKVIIDVDAKVIAPPPSLAIHCCSELRFKRPDKQSLCQLRSTERR